MTEVCRRKAENIHIRRSLCLICAAVIVLALYFGTSVPVCAQDGSPGSSHVSGTVKASDSSSDTSDGSDTSDDGNTADPAEDADAAGGDAADTSENTNEASAASDSGRVPFLADGAQTGAFASVILYILLLAAAVAAVGFIFRLYYKKERYRFSPYGRKEESFTEKSGSYSDSSDRCRCRGIADSSVFTEK